MERRHSDTRPTPGWRTTRDFTRRGGASGIGRALCEELARRGATVIVGDINLPGAGDVASAIAASGGTAFAAYVDVRQAASVQALVEDAVKRHGRLEIIFNNAGMSHHAG